VVSDFGSDVRPGPLAPEHVLGIGTASLTLAQATPRSPVGRALDVGTGSGVQALHLGLHAEHVVATDISPRALRLAATTAALSGQKWDLRPGSLLAPVEGERFELVVANPPFVV
jgi:methylase of polypeptide subunit release factors